MISCLHKHRYMDTHEFLLRLFKIGLTLLLSKLSFFLPDRYFLINFPGGKIYLKLKESRMMICRAFGLYEENKIRLFSDLIKEGMTVVDVGANKGYFTLFFAKLMNDKGKVLSFEPVLDNCYWIERSIRANNYKSIKLYPYALSNKEEKATFYLGEKSGWGSLIQLRRSYKNTITVRTRKLDDVLKEEHIVDVDVMKIDVEGAELLVLKGAEKTLKKNRGIKIAMDMHLNNEERKQICEFLGSCDFKIYKIGRELKPIKKIDETITEVYIKKVTRARGR